MRATPLLAGVALLCACGATPPQAPVGEGERVAAAITGIAEACAQARRESVPYANERRLAPLQAAAHMRAVELAKVIARNPDWIYQSRTLAEVGAASFAYLRGCGLGAAAAPIARTARG